MHPPVTSDAHSRALNTPVAVLAWTMFLVPAIGVPSELVLQDTLKSAVVAFGVLGAALVFFWQQRQRTAPLRWHGLVWLPLVLMGYALGSMLWSHTYLAGVEAIRWFLFALLLWLGLNTLTRENVPILLWGIHGGAVVASVWAVLQFWLDLGVFPQAAQPASTFVNRNFFAEYVVCTLPFSVYLLTTMRPSRWLPLLAGTVALNIVALMMTGTRSALIALWVLAPVLVVILVRYRHQFALVKWSSPARVLVGLVLVAGAGGLGSLPSGNPKVIAENTGTTALERSFVRTASLAKPTEYTAGSFSIRSVMWKATARMVMAHPWTGVGAGAWEVQIPLYQGNNQALETDYYAHNEYLQLLSEYGLPSGGLFLAFLLAYLLIFFRATWQLHGNGLSEAPLRALTLASLLALLLVSNAGFPWHLAGTGALMALCLSLLAGSDARLQHQAPFGGKPRRWQTIDFKLALGVLVLATLMASYITLQAVRAESMTIQAIRLARSQAGAPKPMDTPQAAWRQPFQQAMTINPHNRKLVGLIADQLMAQGDWSHAVQVLESIAASRPHIAGVWGNIALGYAQLNRPAQALQAFQHVQQLQPNALETHALELILLSQAGQDARATALLNSYFDQGVFNQSMVHTGYAIGYKTRNWALAIRSLELGNAMWPIQAADGYFRLGKIYADPAVHDDSKALHAFKQGLAAVPAEQKDNYRNQVPPPYRSQM